jgi:SAM-dependent methyltransferase
VSTYNSTVERDLKILAEAKNYNHWLSSLVTPFCRGRLLEIGAGIGNHSKHLLGSCEEAVLSDYDNRYVAALERKYQNTSNVEVACYRLGDPVPAAWHGRFDTVAVMNVLEHIENDVAAMQEMLSCLSRQGRVVVLGPALASLMSNLDRAYGHFRRYGRREVRSLAEAVDARVLCCDYYNLLGIVGWIKSMIFGAKELSDAEVQTFDRWLVPASQRLEAILKPPIGLGIRFVLAPRGGK